jgi:hypothetical protein
LFSLFDPRVESLDEAVSLHQDGGLQTRNNIKDNPGGGHVEVEAGSRLPEPGPVVVLQVVVEDVVNLKKLKKDNKKHSSLSVGNAELMRE